MLQAFQSVSINIYFFFAQRNYANIKETRIKIMTAKFVC